ncbi:MAG: hypothetical protein QM817_37445 [Archangium sp.]
MKRWLFAALTISLGACAWREQLGGAACENEGHCSGRKPDGSGDCYAWERGTQSREYLQCAATAPCTDAGTLDLSACPAP